jgi:penicillin-binding protein 1A
MFEEGYITREQLIDALETQLNIQNTPEITFLKAPYFTEHVRRYLLQKYGRDLLYRGGLKVYTTLNLRIQHIAREAVKKGLFELDKREGYRGPVRHLEPDEIADFVEEASEQCALSPPEKNSVVEGLVEEVSDERKEVLVRIGEHMARLPLSSMNWARKPNPEVAYYARSVKKPSKVLKKGDVIHVRIIKEATGPLPAVTKNERSGLTWEVSLEQIPEVQGALFSMEPETGEVKAMVGGRDFGISQFDRAIQSRRQPGSAFKPVIYAAALDWGMSPAEIIIDAPYISDQTPDEEVWKPKNYKEKFFGPTLFRTALAKSRNVITIKILKKIGVEYAIDYAKRMGIESSLSPDLSMALGSSGTSLMELTRAYSVFANRGMLVKPIFIRRIIDRSGQTIEENQPESAEVISKETAYVMTDLLKAVIQEGTGWRMKALQRPAAGKTGTTNNLRDAWFIGYTPELVTGVWVGYDDQKAMGKGETGSRAASPLWLYFMSRVLKGQPVVDFEVPDGVVFAKIDTNTGLLAGPYSEKTILQTFKEGTEPTEYSPKPKSAKSGQFFQFDMDHGS